VEREYTILIADRNPHVREFLRREMAAAGYRILLADKGQDVVQRVYQREPLDLLILDPDLPDAEESAVIKKVRNRIPALPVIVHTYIADYDVHRDFANAAFVEKRGNSVENLREAVADILRQNDAEQPAEAGSHPANTRRPSDDTK